MKKKNNSKIKQQVNKKNSNIHKTDGIVTLIASLLVLFTSMFDPKISLVVAVAFLILYSAFKIFVDSR